jgi:hypothetical protein
MSKQIKKIVKQMLSNVAFNLERNSPSIEVNGLSIPHEKFSTKFKLEDFDYISSTVKSTNPLGYMFWVYGTETSIFPYQNYSIQLVSYVLATGRLNYRTGKFTIEKVLRSSDPDDQKLDDAIPLEFKEDFDTTDEQV